MRERCMGKSASRRAGVGRVRRATFSASCQETLSNCARTPNYPPIWRGLLPPSCGMVEILGCGILSLSRGGQRDREELLRRHR